MPCATGARAGLTQADVFLKQLLPEIEKSAAYKDEGMIAITFDEAPQVGPDADPTACCGNPKYPNLQGVAAVTPPGGATTTPTVAAPTTPTTTPPVPPGATSPTTPTAPTTTTPTTPAGTTPTTPANTTPTTPNATTPAPTTGGPTTPTGGGGQVGLLLMSKFVQPGSTDLVDYYNHYSLPASIEDLFGLQHLGYADVASLPGSTRRRTTAPPPDSARLLADQSRDPRPYIVLRNLRSSFVRAAV